MGAQSASRRRFNWLWVVVSALVVLVAAFASVWFLQNRDSSGGQVLATVQPTTASPTDTGTPTLSPTPTPSPSVTPTLRQTPYCRAYAAILAGGQETSEDEGNVDFKKLSATYADLIRKYTAASKLAPSSLQPEYRKVLAYLVQMKTAVDSRDLNGLKEMFRHLSALNSAMDSIQAESKKLCN